MSRIDPAQFSSALADLEKLPWLPPSAPLDSERPFIHLIELNFDSGERHARLCKASGIIDGGQARPSLFLAMQMLERINHAATLATWTTLDQFSAAHLNAMDLCRDASIEAALRASLLWRTAVPVDWASNERNPGRPKRLGSKIDFRGCRLPNGRAMDDVRRELDFLLGPADWMQVKEQKNAMGIQYCEGPKAWIEAVSIQCDMATNLPRPAKAHAKKTTI